MRRLPAFEGVHFPMCTAKHMRSWFRPEEVLPIEIEKVVHSRTEEWRSSTERLIEENKLLRKELKRVRTLTKTFYELFQSIEEGS